MYRNKRSASNPNVENYQLNQELEPQPGKEPSLSSFISSSVSSENQTVPFQQFKEKTLRFLNQKLGKVQANPLDTSIMQLIKDLNSSKLDNLPTLEETSGSFEEILVFPPEDLRTSMNQIIQAQKNRELTLERKRKKLKNKLLEIVKQTISGQETDRDPKHLRSSVSSDATVSGPGSSFLNSDPSFINIDSSFTRPLRRK
uniref:Uncharacterized protein n=1 Tax=Fabrea salina TaxID=342563 RepID=A0A7S3I941_9CILI|mmetsp:Transcript_143/g.263  ORF Transcript_143/g.263 Transcript_143/m.263 type:complete len:200 (+) Transcript_143:72-671(+)